MQQVIIGLAAGLTSCAPPDVDVSYLCYSDAGEWLLPYAGSPVGFRTVPTPPPPSRAKAWLSRNVPAARRAYHGLVSLPVPRSDGALEALEPDIVHFPHQDAFLTKVTSIFHPHDLQHLHLPQLFTRREVMIRESRYKAFCNQAALVAMASTWGRDDILRAYRLPEDKVAVVPLAPVIDTYPEPSTTELQRIQGELRLPPAFCFYPAQTWPHKNHEMLLRAVAQIRERDGLIVPLVFSGSETPYRESLNRLASTLGLSKDVHWVGFVDPMQLRAIYRLARCVVVPTLFEAASQPIFEAMSSGVALACSNVTAAPRQVGDAALIFDPLSVEGIASALKQLWADARLRETLVARGRKRVAKFTWERTARHFLAHYRRLAARELTAEDKTLLSARPII